MPISRSTHLAIPLLAGLAAGGHVQAQVAGGDRYGAAPPAYSTAAGPVSSAPFRGRMLAWPGKEAEPTVAVAAIQTYAAPRSYRQSDVEAASAGRSGRYASAPLRRWDRSADGGAASAPRPTGRYSAGAYPQPHALPAAYAPAPAANDGWRPVFAPPAVSREAEPELAGAPSPAPLPTSIYSPPAAAQVTTAALSPAARAAALPPPLRGSAAQRYGYDPTQDHSVRFYSVHRPFGLQPDPAPIPPQFFTATADLATPPGPLTTERTTSTSSSGATTHTVRATPDAGTD